MKSIFIEDLQIHSNEQNLGYVAHSIEGIGFPGLRVSRYARAGESGAIVSNVLYDGRRILINGTVFSNTPSIYETRRRALQSVLSLVHDQYAIAQPIMLKMTTMDDLAVQIDVYPQELELDLKSESLTSSEYAIDLFAPDQCFESQTLQIATLLRSSGGGAIYPLVYPAVYDASTGGIATATNNGTCESFPIIYLNGPLTSPLIQNVTTEKYLQLDLTLASGEQIIVDMRNKTVLKDGNQSVIANKTDGSSFWWLDVGANILRLFTDSASDTGSLQVHFRDAYIGL